MQEKVKCPICGGLYRKITWMHLKTHGLTIPEFKELYPNFSMSSESLREAARLKSLEQWSDQAKENKSEAMKQYHKDHPKAGDVISKRQIQYYIDNPEVGNAHSEWMVQYFIDNPEIGKDHSEFMIKYYENPDNRDAASNRTTEYFANHPEAAKAHSEWMIEYCKDPEVIKTRSETIKNSEAAFTAQDEMRGGYDIVDHHTIYDHADPTKHIVKMSRSHHTTIHNLLRKLNIEIPRINTEIPWRYS